MRVAAAAGGDPSGEDGRQFSGYPSMRTSAGFNLNWDRFELTLIVRNSHLNRGQPVKLPLAFDLAANQVIPEKWQEVAKHQIASQVVRA